MISYKSHKSHKSYRSRRREHGAVLVEFALTCSMLFLLLFGVMEVGLLYNCQASLSQAACEAARSAALGSSIEVATTRAINTCVEVPLTTSNIVLTKSSDNGVTWVSLTDVTSTNNGVTTTINNGLSGDLIMATVTYAHPNLSSYIFTGATHTMTATIVMSHQ